jgi:phage terminase Nu1 subunit (DNA packaging protein)
MLRTLRSGLLSVPSRVGARCPHLSADDVAAIDAEIRGALTALAEGRP